MKPITKEELLEENGYPYSESTSYTCDICNEEFDDDSSVCKHIDEEHDLNDIKEHVKGWEKIERKLNKK